VRKIRGRSAVRWLPYERIEGTHRPAGIWAAAGPGVARRKEGTANIVDCAPTILAMLGLPIPNDMQGRVIRELFEIAPTIQFEAARVVEQPATREEAFSEGDLQKVTERLSDLGYLE
jgi:arylsulfatase A-like enzyme